MLHVGHITILERAKSLGGTLVVGVPTDELVEEDKGKKPIWSLDDRMSALKSLKCVDVVIPYDKLEFVSNLKKINADVFVIGEDWGKQTRHTEAVNYMRDSGKKVVQFPYTVKTSTSSIKNKVIDQSNPWKEIWENVGNTDDDDYTVVGGYNNHMEYGALAIAKYITEILNIKLESKVLDFGCGSGVILKNLSCVKYGIDISSSLITRAIKNNPNGIFVVSDSIPFKNKFDSIFSYATFQYLLNTTVAENLINQMKQLTNHILIDTLPDVELKNERENKRRELGKNLFPPHLYYSKEFFISRGFKVSEDRSGLTNFSQFCFTAEYKG